MGPAPVRRIRPRRSPALLVMRTAIAAVLGATVVACSGTTTATPVIGSTTGSAVSAPPSTAPSPSMEPAEITSSSVPATSTPASSAAEPPPPSSSITASTGDCVGPFGYSGQSATLIATQGEFTCNEMTAAWNLFLAEFPERSGEVITTSAGWTCTWVDGPGPREPGAVEGDEGGPGCIKDGRSFGPLPPDEGGGSANEDAGSGDCIVDGRALLTSTLPCTEIRRIYALPITGSAGKTVSRPEGWGCWYGGAMDGPGFGVQCSNDTDSFELGSGAGAVFGGPDGNRRSGSTGGSGSESVTAALTNRGCDGTGIVILRSATEPGSYQQVVEEALAANPGASVLRTDASCSSLAPATDAGDPIYAVYLATGSSDRDEVCRQVKRAGGDAYGKWLNASLAPDESRIDC